MPTSPVAADPAASTRSSERTTASLEALLVGFLGLDGPRGNRCSNGAARLRPQLRRSERKHLCRSLRGRGPGDRGTALRGSSHVVRGVPGGGPGGRPHRRTPGGSARCVRPPGIRAVGAPDLLRPPPQRHRPAPGARLRDPTRRRVCPRGRSGLVPTDVRAARTKGATAAPRPSSGVTSGPSRT